MGGHHQGRQHQAAVTGRRAAGRYGEDPLTSAFALIVHAEERRKARLGP